MRNLSLLLIFLFSTMAFAETDKKGNLIGKITDKDGLAISYAAVDLLKDGTIISGAISDDNGNFKVDALEYGTYTLEVKATGYKIYSAEINMDAKEKNAGTIILEENAIALEEARIEVSQVRQEIDKRVVEIGQDLVNAGATAVEVLDRVPSLSVDQQSGELSLRGNPNVRVFVDGKPSNIPVAQLLRQLPSNSIKQVEIITNPSAKYDPEGNSGIINIVTNKQKRKGYNVNTNLGYTVNFRRQYTAGISGNYNTGKLNLFANYNTNFGGRLFKGTVQNLDTNINQTLNFDNDDSSHLVKLGFDWFINEKTALTIYTNQNIYNAEPENTNIINNLDLNRTDTDLTLSDDSNYNQDYSLNFKRDFEQDDHSLELDAFFSFGDNESDAVFNWETAIVDDILDVNGNVIATGDLSDFAQTIDANRDNIRINLDYVKPVWEAGKIEAGVQYRNEGFDNLFTTTQNVRDFIGTTETNVLLPDGTYDFTRNIYSSYINLGYQWEKFGMQLGLRGENVQEDADFLSFGSNDPDLNDSQPINNDYTEFYPSAFFTYNLSKRTQLSLNYSRRVDRPGVNQLSPIREFQTANVRSVGNPDLQPQFTNNYELGFLRRFKGNKGNINASVFYRDISNAITRFLSVDDQAPDGNVTLLQFTNLDDNESYGFEVSGFYKPLKWWSFNSSFDIYYNELIGPDPENLGQTISTDNTVFNFRLSNDFKVSKTVNLQLFSMYRGRNDFLQGTQGDMFMLNIGGRKTFAKGKGTLSINFNDIFDTFNFEGDIRSPFVQDAQFNWGQQSFYMGITYNFGGKVKTRADKQRNRSESGGGGGIGF